MQNTTESNKIIRESIDNIIDYMIVNCDINEVKRKYNKNHGNLDGIQIELDTDNVEDSMKLGISIE